MRAMRPPRNLKISVVITTFDRPLLLTRLLRSVARQTLRPNEVLVVDDHSPDPAALRAALAPLRGKLPSFRLIRMPRQGGVSLARNAGIQATRYPLLALSDDDDEWHPDKLRRQVEVFRKNWEDTDLVYSWFHLNAPHRGATGIRRPAVEGRALKAILWSNFIPLCSAMIKKDKLLKAGLFRKDLFGVEDWEMWVRFFKADFSCRVVPAPLVTYHLHEGSKSRTVPFQALACLRLHFPTFLRHQPLAILRVVKLVSWRWLDSFRKAPQGAPP